MKTYDVILPIGISGSGKTYWRHQLIKEGSQFDVISPDEIRKELTGDISSQSKNEEVWKLVYSRIKDSLLAGHSVFLDATNISTFNRKSIVKYIYTIKKDATIAIKVFHANEKLSIQRIHDDIAAGIERSNVPDEVIRRQCKSYLDTLKSLTVKDECAEMGYIVYDKETLDIFDLFKSSIWCAINVPK